MRRTLFIRVFVPLTLALTIGAVGCEKQAPEPAPEQAVSPELEAKIAESVEVMDQAEATGALAAGEEPTTQPSVVAEPGAKPGAEKGGMPAPIEAGETKVYGDDFTIIEPPITLASAIEGIDANAGKLVKIEARIDKVCKAKGCWFTLAADDVDRPVRVKMKDYGFFVPRNADGTAAIVEGALTKRTMPKEEAQHYADDAAKAGEAAKTVEGPQDVYEFTATTVQITRS